MNDKILVSRQTMHLKQKSQRLCSVHILKRDSDLKLKESQYWMNYS